MFRLTKSFLRNNWLSNFFFKRAFPASFSLYSSNVNKCSFLKLSNAEFEPRSSDLRSDRYANCVTTTAHNIILYLDKHIFQSFQNVRGKSNNIVLKVYLGMYLALWISPKSFWTIVTSAVLGTAEHLDIAYSFIAVPKDHLLAKFCNLLRNQNRKIRSHNF